LARFYQKVIKKKKVQTEREELENILAIIASSSSDSNCAADFMQINDMH